MRNVNFETFRAVSLGAAALAVVAIASVGPAPAFAQERPMLLAQSPSAERVRQAEAALERARDALREAKDSNNPNNWQTIQGGGRVPKPGYAERVERLEADVKRAEEALEKAKRDAL